MYLDQPPPQTQNSNVEFVHSCHKNRMAIIMTWRETKDAGKQAFSEGDYPEALSLYSDAVDQLLASSENGNHVSEHQILLSNVIACRLKIGGEDMVGKAVDEAKEVCLFFS